MRTHLLHPIYPPPAEREPDTGCACNDEFYVVQTLADALETTRGPIKSSLPLVDALDAYVLGGYAGI
jgi:hypothetical protein